VNTDGANSQTPSGAIPRTASAVRMLARGLISDRRDGLRQKIADLARDSR
jgi:hypothetical protein